MEYNRISNRGEFAIGFIDIYELKYKKNARCIINYLPLFKEIDTQNICVTILLEGEKGAWTDGEIKEILNDMGEYIKVNDVKRFRSGKKLDYYNTQIFYISKLDGFEYLSHGDFSYRF